MKPSQDAQRKESEKRYARLVAAMWADEGFKKRLMSNTPAVLREYGFDIPEDKHVKILEADIENTIYFIVPPRPVNTFSEVPLGPNARPTVCCSWCGKCIELCLCWND